MRLWIMRHGEAEPMHAATDAQRSLTARGQQQARASAEWLLAQGFAHVPVIASPYRRAQQTAGIVAAALHTPAIETLDVLEPGGDPRRVTAWLAERAEPALLLVSHMPLVGQLLHWLEEGVLAGGLPFSVAQLMALEMEVAGPGQARRAGMYIPDWQGR